MYGSILQFKLGIEPEIHATYGSSSSKEHTKDFYGILDETSNLFPISVCYLFVGGTSKQSSLT